HHRVAAGREDDVLLLEPGGRGRRVRIDLEHQGSPLHGDAGAPGELGIEGEQTGTRPQRLELAEAQQIVHYPAGAVGGNGEADAGRSRDDGGVDADDVA